MFNYFILTNSILYVGSFILFYIITTKQSSNDCKLEKFSIFLYSTILELIWIILYNTCLYFVYHSTSLHLTFNGLLCIIITIAINEIFANITFKYLYLDETYNISSIMILEVLLLKIYPYFKRVKRWIYRILKKIIQLIPIIILELLFIYIFSLFISLQDKSWEIFELVLTTVIITAYINIYDSERDRRRNLKWQYKYSYFVEYSMYDYIEKMLLLIGIHSKYDDEPLDYFADSSEIIYNIENYNNTPDYQNFLNKYNNNTEQVQKYIEDLTETFINNLKEHRNEIIYIKQNENNEDFLYHHCINDANKLKREILLSDISEIGNIILQSLPELIEDCSTILKLINSIWDEDDIYELRILNLLKNSDY